MYTFIRHEDRRIVLQQTLKQKTDKQTYTTTNTSTSHLSVWAANDSHFVYQNGMIFNYKEMSMIY